MTLELRNPDFATAVRIADAINAYSWARYRRRGAAQSKAPIPSRSTAARRRRDPFHRRDRRICMVEPDTPARVVIDSRTGTVVIGQDVQISPVAVTQGSLTVRVTETPQVSQPAPFSQRGRTVVTPQTEIDAKEGGGWVAMIGGRSLQALVHRPEPHRRQAAGHHRHPAGDQGRGRIAGRHRGAIGRQPSASLPDESGAKDATLMIRRFRQRLYRLCTPALLCAAALVPCVGPARANEDGVAAEARQVEAKQPQVETKLQASGRFRFASQRSRRSSPWLSMGMKGVENFCGAIAASAAERAPRLAGAAHQGAGRPTWS